MARGYREQANSWFESLVDEINDVVVDAMKTAVESGENITKHNIENRGTEKSGKRGRVETGRMRDSVTSGIVQQNEEEVVGRFGFENAPYYSEYQEKGFRHVSGVDVEGMFALSDAAEEVIQDMQADLKRGFRGV